METLGRMRIKLFVLAALKKTLIANIFRYSFICLRCVVPVSVHYSLCLVTLCRKVLLNWRLVKLSDRTQCWCAFSWSICNQNGHCVRCIQSSSSIRCDGIHKSWEDVVSSVAENQNYVKGVAVP